MPCASLLGKVFIYDRYGYTSVCFQECTTTITLTTPYQHHLHHHYQPNAATTSSLSDPIVNVLNVFIISCCCFQIAQVLQRTFDVRAPESKTLTHMRTSISICCAPLFPSSIVFLFLLSVHPSIGFVFLPLVRPSIHPPSIGLMRRRLKWSR